MTIYDLTLWEAVALIDPHVKEISDELGDLVRDPQINTDILEAIDRSGALRIIGAFDGRKFAGIGAMVISLHQHYKSVVASNILIYLIPEYRRGRSGLKLIAAMEKQAVIAGADSFYWHVKPGSTLEKIMRWRGLYQEEVVYRNNLNM